MAARLFFTLILSISMLTNHSNANTGAIDPCKKGGNPGSTQNGSVVPLAPSCPGVPLQAPNPLIEIAPNNSAKVNVSGGTGPFQWTLSNTDFGFDAACQTQTLADVDRDQTVYSCGDGCSAGTTTITDVCSNDVNITVNVSTSTLNYVFGDADSQVATYDETTGHSRATVTVTGGVPPYTYTLTAPFSFDPSSSQTSLFTSDREVYVYNLNNAGCGTVVDVSDSCGYVSGYVRGQGGWSGEDDTACRDGSCPVSGDYEEKYDDWWGNTVYEKTQGRYLLRQITNGELISACLDIGGYEPYNALPGYIGEDDCSILAGTPECEDCSSVGPIICSHPSWPECGKRYKGIYYTIKYTLKEWLCPI